MTTIMTLSLALVMGSTGQCTNPAHQNHWRIGVFVRDFHGSGGFIEPDGPGNGWGFPNGSSDEYGWHDPDVYPSPGPKSNRGLLLPTLLRGPTRASLSLAFITIPT